MSFPGNPAISDIVATTIESSTEGGGSREIPTTAFAGTDQTGGSSPLDPTP